MVQVKMVHLCHPLMVPISSFALASYRVFRTGFRAHSRWPVWLGLWLDFWITWTEASFFFDRILIGLEESARCCGADSLPGFSTGFRLLVFFFGFLSALTWFQQVLFEFHLIFTRFYRFGMVLWSWLGFSSFRVPWNDSLIAAWPVQTFLILPS